MKKRWIIPNGKYTIRVEKDGHFDKERNILIFGDDKKISINLEKIPIENSNKFLSKFIYKQKDVGLFQKCKFSIPETLNDEELIFKNKFTVETFYIEDPEENDLIDSEELFKNTFKLIYQPEIIEDIFKSKFTI